MITGNTRRRIEVLIGIFALFLIPLTIGVVVASSTSELDLYKKLSANIKSCGLKFVPRNEWNAKTSACPQNKKFAYDLVKYVFVNESTISCRKVNTCKEKVEELQKTHQNRYCDIFYNFLVTELRDNDNLGLVYEGKGFSHQEKSDDTFTAKDLVLSIGLIPLTKRNSTLTYGLSSQLDLAADCFITQAQKLNFLDKNFRKKTLLR